MITYIKNRYKNAKISKKMLLALIVFSISSSMVLSALTYLFSFTLFIEREKKENEHLLNSLSYTIEDTAYQLNATVLNLGSSSAFKRLCDGIQFGNQNYAAQYNNMQTSFDDVLKQNNMVDSVFLLDKDGNYYNVAIIGRRYQDEVVSLFNKLNDTKIQWFSNLENPINQGDHHIIPVLYPFSITQGGFPFIPNADVPIDLKVFVTLKGDKLKSELSAYNQNPYSFFYLFNDAGDIVLNQETPYADSLKNSVEFTDYVANTDYSNSTTVSFEGEKYLVSLKTLEQANLKILNIIAYNDLLKGTNELNLFMIFSILFNIGLSFVISFILAKQLTKPIEKLTKSVSLLTDNNYTPTYINENKDELGTLTQSINRMCSLIHQQIDQLLIEENEKHKAKSKMLLQQMNPHFLYNTLEFIHLEILNNHNSNASKMVESLGTFLRYTLRAQGDIVPLNEELKHAQTYLEIVNLRTQKIIPMLQDIPSELLSLQVPRFILQPCLENCIIHGFKDVEVVEPQIIIKAELLDCKLLLKVIDNGCGIDIAKATKSLHEKTSNSHIGIHNIYQRLQLFYGMGFSITFHSIPYFENYICIEIPIYTEST